MAWSGEEELEGELTVLEDNGEVIGYCFVQPENRKHLVQLKEGIQLSALEEIDD